MNECGNVKMWKCGNEPGVVISNGVRREADEVRNLTESSGTNIKIDYTDTDVFSSKK